MTENELAKEVFILGMKVHRELGPGLLERIYEECLFYELNLAGIEVEKQKSMPVKYKEISMEQGYIIDLLIENKLLVEIKSVNELNNIHLAQTLTYLRMTNCKLGLLINFNVPLFKDGVKRVINGNL